MLNFERELEKFKPVLDIDKIEKQIATEDMRDIMDLMKQQMKDKNVKMVGKKEHLDKEI